MTDDLRALVDAWEKRAETYRRLGEDEAARHVEMCVWELEIWLEKREGRIEERLADELRRQHMGDGR